MAEKLVTLTTFTYTTEAYVLVAKLDAEGIKSFLKNDNLVSTQHFLSNAVGGIDVQVPETELLKAREILQEVNSQKKESQSGPEGLAKDLEKVLTYCPECESSNVFRKKGSLFSFGPRDHFCGDCHLSWKQ